MKTEFPGALATMRALCHSNTTQHVAAGDVIFASGARGDCLYGIVSGSVKVDWDGGCRRETLGEGQCFGVGALVDPEHRRYGNAIALTDAELLVMNREQFIFALQELPVFGLEVLQSLEERLLHLKTDSSSTRD